MATAYGTASPEPRHGGEPPVAAGPPWWWHGAPLALPAVTAVGVVVGASLRRGSFPRPTACLLGAVLVGVVVALVAAGRHGGGRGSRSAVVALGLVGAVLGWRAWDGVATVRTGAVEGRAVVMSDPVERSGALDVVLEVGGERYQVWGRGSPRRRLAVTLTGDTVWISGTLSAPDTLQGWAVARHVVGSIDLDRVSDRRDGAPAFRAANRVRRVLDHGARTMTVADRALWSGLVYGDDRAVEQAVVDDFRASGLSHLTAVSGQNVALLLAAAAPLLRRLGPWCRWTATLGLIGWFALLTRFEPSVLRASVMAAIGATAFVTGRERSGVGLLSLAVTGLLLVDPLLAWSIGLWLSAGATAGLALWAAPIEHALPLPGWLARPLSASLAAQIGVLPVSTAVFGLPSVVSLAANLVAVPVAGMVMLVGLPSAVVAAVVPDPLAALVQVPGVAGVRWVTAVARTGAALAPPTPVSAACWLVIVVALMRRRRRTMAAAAPDVAALGAPDGESPPIGPGR